MCTKESVYGGPLKKWHTCYLRLEIIRKFRDYMPGTGEDFLLKNIMFLLIIFDLKTKKKNHVCITFSIKNIFKKISIFQILAYQANCIPVGNREGLPLEMGGMFNESIIFYVPLGLSLGNSLEMMRFASAYVSLTESELC